MTYTNRWKVVDNSRGAPEYWHNEGDCSTLSVAVLDFDSRDVCYELAVLEPGKPIHIDGIYHPRKLEERLSALGSTAPPRLMESFEHFSQSQK